MILLLMISYHFKLTLTSYQKSISTVSDKFSNDPNLSKCFLSWQVLTLLKSFENFIVRSNSGNCIKISGVGSNLITPHGQSRLPQPYVLWFYSEKSLTRTLNYHAIVKHENAQTLLNKSETIENWTVIHWKFWYQKLVFDYKEYVKAGQSFFTMLKVIHQ